MILKNNPLPPFTVVKEMESQCNCCSKEEYDEFLISEYGLDRVQRVKQQAKDFEDFLRNMTNADKLSILICGSMMR